MRIRQALATGLLALTPALSGCLSHTRTVPKTHPPAVVLNATLDQLLKQTDDRYDSIRSMTLSVEISTSTGGSTQGQVKETIAFGGFIVIGKPEQIQVILLLPVLRSTALNMVSDGKTFKMLIPPRNCAIVGSDLVTNSSQKGLYSLRPAVILDPLLIRGLQDDQIVSMTQDSRIITDPKKRKELIDDPDYDLEFLSQPEDRVARSQRVLHIDRVNLLPWRQDIYNADGKVETQAFYSNYKKFGDVNFPTKIVIQRPLDELGLTITITKAAFNQQLPADQFKLDIASGIAVTNMDDPASAAIAPCGAHAAQSPH
jgi:outer membrane lipoprotein-sorting protein